MAFAQQQRRPVTYRNLTASSSSEDYYHQRNNSLRSDSSETDWHVISSALPSSQSSSSNSPILLATAATTESESYASSSHLVSDTEDSLFSDLENVQQAFLPSHDGTGTFLMDESDQTTTTTSTSTTSNDEESESETTRAHRDSLMDMIQAPYGGIGPPSFLNHPPRFIPTIAGLSSQELISAEAPRDNDNTFLSDEGRHSRTTKPKRQRPHPKDLDKIPIHHPGIPGLTTSAAILSVVWDSLRRLRDHLIENDTNTAETISSLMSEAVFEGCMPFSSHLHMDFDNGIRTSSSYSLFEEHITI
ncbi:MAG: hypothetical protein EXX96DRAFT_586430 [Benjaminiella poitrasii]|nr:MAG: hypothetical protein EXX96DRAFT_586430 [Benjaminiella poitrasii]